MTPDFDAIVVGGGPVGLSVGIQLAKKGVRTLLCEKRRFPVDKPCGEGIMPTGLSELKRLNLEEPFLATQSHPFKGIGYFDPQGNSAFASFKEGPGLGVRRTELSRVLLDGAQRTGHLHIEEGVEIEKIDRIERGVRVYTKARSYSAFLLVGADGVRSNVRRWTNLEGAPSHLRRWGVNQHFSHTPWSSYVEVYWTPGLEAYVTPCGDNQVGVAFLWSRDSYKPVASGKKLAMGLLEQFPSLYDRLQGSMPIGETQAIGPLHRRVRSSVCDNVVLVGDAAGYLDPITGEGISIGLGAARQLSEWVVPLLARQHLNPSENAFAQASLLPYDKALRKQNEHYVLTTKLVLMLARYPNLVERMVKTLQKDPDLFQHLLSANMGTAKLFAHKPHKTLGIGFSLLMEMSARAPNLLTR